MESWFTNVVWDFGDTPGNKVNGGTPPYWDTANGSKDYSTLVSFRLLPWGTLKI